MHQQPQAATRPVRSIPVERDQAGLRLAMLDLLEEGRRIGKLMEGSMAPETQAQHRKAIVAERRLSAGYYIFAGHILRLDAERNVGLPLDPHTLTHFEGESLRTLASARNEHAYRHPACGRCGAQQDSRHHPKCTSCGAEFGAKKRGR